MKFSLNSVKEFLDFDLPPVNELVEKISTQLGAVEEVVDIGKKYQGIVIAKVVSCQPHPNADKLSLCLIYDGGVVKDVERNENGLVQVVCGAPNVREGMMVAWLPPGRTVPSSFETTEPFVLEAREIRGQKSNGMLASPKESALGDSHTGILALDVVIQSTRIKKGEIPHVEALHNYLEKPNIKPGDDFAETYKLNDIVIEIENKMFTHRPDLFGILGVAREIAGILGKQFTSPAVYKSPKTAASTDKIKDLEIRNEVPELVPRFVAQLFENVTIGPAPVWLQAYLSRLGIRPINNVVDITNYFMVLTGQPLHAYDYDKVKALSSGDDAVIVVRNPKPGEKLKLLNGKEVEPRSEAIMIATDKQLIGIGGVMGGAETEVDATTTRIILECATFDMYSIRRTAMTHGLFTDAVTRFTKGQSPLQNDRVTAWAEGQLVCDTGGFPSGFIDLNHVSKEVLERDSLYPPITASTSFINSRLGLKLSAGEIQTLLENVEFKIEMRDKELLVTAPFWRTDIELREDVVEEVGRLYGYDHLPLELPMRVIEPVKKDPLLETKAVVRRKLAKAGANEVLTYSFVHGDLLEKTGQDTKKAFQIANALSPDLQYYRITLMPSLLEKVHPNIKAGYDEFALFELGKSHSTDHITDDLPGEYEFAALVVAAADKLKRSGAAYYEARKYLEALVGKDALTFKPVSREMQAYPVVQPYDPNRSALVSLKGGEFLGIMGEFKPSVRRVLKLPKHSAGFEIDTTVLQTVVAAGPRYTPLSRFPKVTQDMTLSVPADLAYQELYDFVREDITNAWSDEAYIKLESLDMYQSDDDRAHKHVTFRLHIASYTRTLTDSEVNKLLDEVAATAKATFGAERV